MVNTWWCHEGSRPGEGIEALLPFPTPCPTHLSHLVAPELYPWDWNAKVGSQETPGVTGKFSLGVRNEAEQRLIEFCQQNALVIANTLYIGRTY